MRITLVEKPGAVKRSENGISGRNQTSDQTLLSGKPATRQWNVPNSGLCDQAKAGLQSKEDIKKANQLLRTTDKDSSGLSAERINEYDGVKPVMLLYVKGVYSTQMRLVEPSWKSFRSEDVYILVIPKAVLLWTGKSSPVLKKAKGVEYATVIQKWRELNCVCGGVTKVAQESHSSNSLMLSHLGEFSETPGTEGIDDRLYDQALLQTNRVYDVIKNDSSWELERNSQHCGKALSIRMLHTNSAFVFDFGTEVYSWVGRDCAPEKRKAAFDLGLELFQSEYQVESCISPINPFEMNSNSDQTSALRPEWAVYGRMTQKSENILFRSKFCDWPDPVTLGTKTTKTVAVGKLHPVDIDQMLEETDDLGMVLDGMIIGRGRGGMDPESLFKFLVITSSIKFWVLQDKDYVPLDDSELGMFHSAEAYMVEWGFHYKRTDVRTLKGERSPHDDSGRDCILYFYWQGEDCTITDKGTSAVRVAEIVGRRAHQVRMTQSKESAAFFSLFQGNMVVQKGSRFQPSKEVNDPTIFWLRNDLEHEACLVELPENFQCFSQHGAYIVLPPASREIIVWTGTQCSLSVQASAKAAARSLSARFGNRRIVVVQAGFEPKTILELISERGLMTDDPSLHIEACYHFCINKGEFQAIPVRTSSYHPDIMNSFPVLQAQLYAFQQPALVLVDTGTKMFLWQGWTPELIEETPEGTPDSGLVGSVQQQFSTIRTLAFASILNYADRLGRDKSLISIVNAGMETPDFKHLFPHWEVNPVVVEIQRRAGLSDGGSCSLLAEMKRLEEMKFSLEILQQRPLPAGVDPMFLEKYLKEEDFMVAFKVSVTEFASLPRWKQISLRKQAGLF